MLEKERNKGNFGGNEIKCHTERFLLSISTALEKQGGDPEQKRLRMTSDKNVGQVLPDNKGSFVTLLTSPLEREDVRRTKEGIWNKLGCITPLLAFGHPLPQGARETRCGFTLIELLVVVLIIGILAAVAVPQYQFAVDKSIVSSYFPLIRNIVQAKHLYYLANGTRSGDLTALDVDASKLCPILTGQCHNEIWNCKPGNVGIDANCKGKGINLKYCVAGNYCGSMTDRQNIHIIVNISDDDGQIFQCNAYTARGRKLCNWLKPS